MEAKELNKVTVEVKVNGTSCDFSYLELRQTMYGHHVFSIHLNYRAKEQDLWAVTAEQVVEQLGSAVTIQIQDAEGATIDFDGVLTKVDVGGKHSNQGEVVLYGGSPTLLMQNDYSMASFVETDLASIVHETVTNIGYKIDSKIEPLNNREIPYICRYKESSYDFLNRLLSSCGEWFFYDGKKLIVGFSAEQNNKEVVALSYKHDLVEMNISSTLGNYDVEQYDYDPTRDLIAQWPSPPESKNLNKFTRKAFNFSKTVYQDYTILPSTIPVCQKTFDLMENSVNATHFGKLSEGSLLTATTTSCKMALGGIVSLEVDPDMAKYSKELGKYRLVEVVHRYDENKKSYENDIVGINADIDYIPARGVVQPTALPEIAKVMDNQDPRNMGRVKVQFAWQQLEDHPQGKTSGWMRVQIPNAGSSEVVDKNRGFFFIPEIDDQVMVGYEYGDPSRPFVMGSLYHCNNTSGIADNNKVKSITTRSGSTLTIDDDAHTILLCTSKANQIFIDEQNGVIAITSAEEVNVTTKNVNIDASENMTVTVGKDFNMTVGGESNVTIKGNSTVSVEKDSNTTIKGSSEYTIDGEHSLTAVKKLNIHTDANAEIDADGQMTVASQKNMYVKSKAKVDIAKG